MKELTNPWRALKTDPTRIKLKLAGGTRIPVFFVNIREVEIKLEVINLTSSYQDWDISRCSSTLWARRGCEWILAGNPGFGARCNYNWEKCTCKMFGRFGRHKMFTFYELVLTKVFGKELQYGDIAEPEILSLFLRSTISVLVPSILRDIVLQQCRKVTQSTSMCIGTVKYATDWKLVNRFQKPNH